MSTHVCLDFFVDKILTHSVPLFINVCLMNTQILLNCRFTYILVNNKPMTMVNHFNQLLLVLFFTLCVAQAIVVQNKFKKLESGQSIMGINTASVTAELGEDCLLRSVNLILLLSSDQVTSDL